MKKPEIEIRGNVMTVKADSETDMNSFNEIMNMWQDSMVAGIKALAEELDITESVAGDIMYLRSRSRWTQELEDQIIAAFRSGNPIDSGLILSGEWPEK